MKDSLGDRMKANYEDRGRHYLIRRMPVVIRVDGRAFHTFTRNMERPYDGTFARCMVESAVSVAKYMAGFKIGYVQSDEASFVLTNFDTLHTEAWFDYNKSKIESLAASVRRLLCNDALLEQLVQHGATRIRLAFTMIANKSWSWGWSCSRTRTGAEREGISNTKTIAGVS